MALLRSFVALLACAAIGTQAAPAVDQLQSRGAARRQAQNAEAVRLQFMSDILGAPASSNMVKDLSSDAIKNVIVTKADPAKDAPVSPAFTASEATNATQSNLVARSFVSGAQLDDLKLHQAYAAASYCLAGIENWTCRERCSGPTAGTIIVKKFDTLLTNTVGFVGYNPSQKAIIVSFRGTLSIRNAINDLKFYKVDADYKLNRIKVPDGAKIHGGFGDAYNAAASTVRSAVQQILNGPGKDFNIHVVGHSMGGAIGILGAIDLYDFLGESFGNKIKVYSFGEPRVGNKAWASWVYTLPFFSNMFRVTHNTDIVPHLPPKAFDFLHHRAEYWITSKGDLSTCDDSLGEAAACAGSVIIPSIVAHLVGYFDIPFGPWC
ncbi:uncharacterized protein SPPG_04520 [Spizellomyces punctatus DAOM BR117]|uniref:Fungal lipase-type domain-containing protein n=1 Tax=Spizellomyces punctatus (strain DAOM BR117) TaxID=645134 RepID=A0A0L0HHB6_SPIPD|nr:uncharacterized protein SPPG_04520 [Spizellomyces punctatus DAOM BR117]KND00179.1 hypothetical protein SPPG_04520 [Spizellomyces punctatus DAOM BR117]|eukprot:XP_016608218.1 hypothetical protein SPPG_04520 [Spizellomyces punctatus DAOM BR117]